MRCSCLEGTSDGHVRHGRRRGRENKFDILSQRGLGKIKDAMDMVRAEIRKQAIDIHDIVKADEGVRAMLREARATGCFYVESPAMRMLMRKLQVDDYLGLVAASSVIRPGVSRSGMMRAYIERHRDPARRAGPSVLCTSCPRRMGSWCRGRDQGGAPVRGLDRGGRRVATA